MNILRLLALSSITMLLIPMSASAHCAGKHSGNHPHCPGGGEDPSVVYTAELRGAFVFGPLPVTVEGQNNRLTAAQDLVMTRDATTEKATWDDVFSMPDPEPCDLFGPPPGAVNSFTALKKEKPVKGWRISLPGGVYVQFGGELLTAPDSAAAGAWVNVSLQLRGNCEYSGGTDPDCDPFLPDPDVVYEIGRGKGISEIPLALYSIHAKARKGEPQFEGCHDASNDLLEPSTLVITATAP